ncbi:MAG: serine/threonine-protein kinase, partial [Planctomycetota bacterium]
MNETMDPEILQRFLNGNATEDEAQLCESFLKTATDISPDLGRSNSLLDTLNNLSGEQTLSPLDDLIEKIQSVGPKKSIGQEELDRVLGPAESDFELGTIGRYKIIEFVAGGGMGLVFKAEDPRLGRLVCLKILHPIMASNEEAKTRFAREAKSASKLKNDRIVTVLDLGEHRELPFLVMQLLDGKSLRQAIDSDPDMDHDNVRDICRQIAEGLDYAHSKGILHRDIKPENILLASGTSNTRVLI